MSTENEGKFLIKKRSLIVIIIATLLFGAVCGGGVIHKIETNGGKFTIVKKEDFVQSQYMNNKYAKVELLYQQIEKTYYKKIGTDVLMDGIYKGLFAGIGDPYTSYLTPAEYESVMAQATGDFYGIGVTVTATKDGYVQVVSTMEGSPAEKAGIKTGDFITMVDGTKYSGAELDKAAAAMRGKINTKVRVTYSRDGENKEITLVRKKITTKSVYSTVLKDKVGYIRIASFEMATDEDFKTELRSMEVKGVKGIVIDLRNNGGGVVESGVAIADMLIKEGTIVYLEDNKGEKTYYNSDASATAIPYVLLVNGGTASTSEILAAAVKGNKAGHIVGNTTFGKGIVQNIQKLKDGSAVKVTVQQYFSPDGKTIHGVGIIPDYPVDLIENDETDYQLNKAIELLK